MMVSIIINDERIDSIDEDDEDMVTACRRLNQWTRFFMKRRLCVCCKFVGM